MKLSWSQPLDWIRLPSRWVDSTIAATVVLAAVNNLYPMIDARRWLIAFCLGLIHGFDFARLRCLIKAGK